MDYTTHLQNGYYDDAMQSVASDTSEYYLALFYKRFTGIRNVKRDAVRADIGDLYTVITENKHLSKELGIISDLLSDILSDKHCSIEPRVWVDTKYTWRYRYTPFDEVYDSSDDRYRREYYTPLQSSALITGDAETRYDFYDLDLVFQYLYPAEIIKSIEYIANCFDVWAFVVMQLKDYCAFTKDQLCPNPDCLEGTIKAREHQCEKCGSYRTIHYDDTELTQNYISHRRIAIKERMRYDALPPEEQNKEAMRGYAPGLIIFGALDLLVLALIIFL